MRAANKRMTDPDEVPEVPAEPVSTAGDLWLLGQHRLLCGDSTAATDVKRVLGSVRPHLMVTDPPYGVDYEPNWRNEAARNGSLVHTIGATAVGKVQNDGRVDWREAWSLFPGEVGYVWHAGIHAHRVAEGLESAGFATGDTARLEGDGKTFAAVTAQRREPPQRPPVGQRKAKRKPK